MDCLRFGLNSKVTSFGIFAALIKGQKGRKVTMMTFLNLKEQKLNHLLMK